MDRNAPILTWMECGQWVAVWTAYDVAAQGPTEGEAVARLLRTIAGRAIIEAALGESPYSNIPKPTPEMVARWQRLHDEQHKRASKEGR